MIRPIVVPLDGSKFAETALPIAADFARLTGAALELVTVHAPISAVGAMEGATAAMVDADRDIRAQETAYLDSVVARMTLETGLKVTSMLAAGPVVPALIDFIQTRRPQLVVISSHGRSGLTRLFLGSVADHLIRHHLASPVVVVRPDRPAVPSSLLGDRRILIPLDGSSLAETVIDHVLELFPKERTTLELLRVVPPILRPATAGADIEHCPGALYLASIAKLLRSRGVQHVHTRICVADDLVPAMLDHIESEQPTLLALATHGLGGLERALVGSVGDELVRRASVPTLVWTPPPGAVSEILERAMETLSTV